MDKNLRFFAFFAGAFCAALATAGCTTHQCDASTIAIGADAGGTGTWFADDCQNATSGCTLTWHSTPTMDSDWTDFPGNATLTFTYPPLPPLPPGLTPDFADITFGGAVAATAPVPDADFNVTPIAGQLGEFTPPWSSSSITVKNASCQEYQLLLIVTVPVVPSGSALPGDGSSDGSDGGAADAPSDAPVGDATVSDAPVSDAPVGDATVSE